MCRASLRMSETKKNGIIFDIYKYLKSLQEQDAASDAKFSVKFFWLVYYSFGFLIQLYTKF